MGNKTSINHASEELKVDMGDNTKGMYSLEVAETVPFLGPEYAFYEDGPLNDLPEVEYT